MGPREEHQALRHASIVERAMKLVVRAIRALSARIAIRQDAVGYFKRLGVRIGNDCRLLNTNPGTFGAEPYLVTLGNHVTVTSGVQFVTHDGGVWVFRERYPDIDVFARVTVGNNVFIGLNAILLPGTEIGDNCVIGAGSVVKGRIPPNSVAAGVPARVIRSLDEYWDSLQPRALHIRSQEETKKRRAIEDHLPLVPNELIRVSE